MLRACLSCLIAPGAFLSMVLSRMFRRTYGRCKPLQAATILLTGPVMLTGIIMYFHFRGQR